MNNEKRILPSDEGESPLVRKIMNGDMEAVRESVENLYQKMDLAQLEYNKARLELILSAAPLGPEKRTWVYELIQKIDEKIKKLKQNLN